MFGTLRIGSEKEPVEFVEYAKGEAASRLGGYVFSQSACERCRLKKLRCNKQKSGCDRCKGQALKCSYQVAAKSSSSWSSSKSHFQANSSDTSGTAGTSNTPSPRENNGVDTEIGGWTIDETDVTGSVVTTTPPSSRGDPNQLGYSENELNDLFSNIADLQPDGMQAAVFTGGANATLLNAEAFDSMTEAADSILDGIGDIAAPQPASADTQSPFMAFDYVGTSPSSSSRQTSDVSASDDSLAISFGRARPTAMDSSSCQCQRSILDILAEIESNILSANPSNMYATLSYQRRTTAASNSILTSRICNCKIKLFGLLEIISGKITRLSEAIITAFVCSVKEHNDSVDFGESGSPDKRLYRNSAIRLGEFQVQTLQEFKVVSAAAIKLQLKYSVTFVSRTRALAISLNRLAQAQSLKRLEGKLKELCIKMQRMTSELESECCDI
ncbi:hypothetical protein GGS24DRAFT_510627 [Hypoxylon argillaceum]|nr:hypothetical protein GGS24DRAFT_510627 [Hypoxylon argillaceum]